METELLQSRCGSGRGLVPCDTAMLGVCVSLTQVLGDFWGACASSHPAASSPRSSWLAALGNDGGASPFLSSLAPGGTSYTPRLGRRRRSVVRSW